MNRGNLPSHADVGREVFVTDQPKTDLLKFYKIYAFSIKIL